MQEIKKKTEKLKTKNSLKKTKQNKTKRVFFFEYKMETTNKGGVYIKTVITIIIIITIIKMKAKLKLNTLKVS